MTKKGKKVAVDVYRKLVMLETRAFAEISQRDLRSLKKALQSLEVAAESPPPRKRSPR